MTKTAYEAICLVDETTSPNGKYYVVVLAAGHSFGFFGSCATAGAQLVKFDSATAARDRAHAKQRKSYVDEIQSSRKIPRAKIAQKIAEFARQNIPGLDPAATVRLNSNTLEIISPQSTPQPRAPTGRRPKRTARSVNVWI